MAEWREEVVEVNVVEVHNVEVVGVSIVEVVATVEEGDSQGA